MATMVSASHCVGFTLPGMMEDPGSFSGRVNSPSPQRGPEASQRMSLAIFMSDALRDLAGGAFGEFGMSIEPGANSGPADGQIVQTVERFVDAFDVAVKQADPAGKFLPHGKRRSVLQVSASNFHDANEFFCLSVQRVAQICDGRQKLSRGFRGGGDMHG